MSAAGEATLAAIAPVARFAVACALKAYSIARAKLAISTAGAHASALQISRTSAIRMIFVPYLAVASSVLADAVARARYVVVLRALHWYAAGESYIARVAVALGCTGLADTLAIASVYAQSVRAP